MYNYGVTSTGYDLATNASAGLGSLIWGIISLILAIVGAFVIYFLFVKSNKKFANKFVEWLKNYLDFQNLLIEPILKIAYIFTAIFLTLGSFSLIGTSFVAFLATLIGGNIIARVIYEFSMMMISIWQNTRDINKKMK